MGDGQHIWAASDWLMLVRNLFVREEGDTLVIGSGIAPAWLASGELSFGPTLTPHGAVSVSFETGPRPRVHITGRWRRHAPAREIRVPGFAPVSIGPNDPRDDFVLLPL